MLLTQCGMISAQVMEALPNGLSILRIFAQVPEKSQDGRHQAVFRGDGGGGEQLVDAFPDNVIRVVHDRQHWRSNSVNRKQLVWTPSWTT